MKGKTAVLLVNLGSPDSPKVSDVRRYLVEFLNDPRVIDVPAAWRKILVNLLIVPFRSPKTAKIYKELWTEKGSPLITISESLQSDVQNQVDDHVEVFLAMRYQKPSLRNVLAEIKKGYFKKLIIIPLFPHYASATTGSIHEEVMRVISKWWVIPELRFVSQFYDDPDFIDIWVERGNEYKTDEYEHVLFSYHGLPTRQVDKVFNEGRSEDRDFQRQITHENQYDYQATCYATTRLIAQKLNIPSDKYTVCFQSRLNKNWLEPFSDHVVIEKAKAGVENLLVFSPAFVADCLETTVEIGSEYAELFYSNGGSKLTLVESLNTHPLWIKFLVKLINNNI